MDWKVLSAKGNLSKGLKNLREQVLGILGGEPPKWWISEAQVETCLVCLRAVAGVGRGSERAGAGELTTAGRGTTALAPPLLSI